MLNHKNAIKSRSKAARDIDKAVYCTLRKWPTSDFGLAEESFKNEREPVD